MCECFTYKNSLYSQQLCKKLQPNLRLKKTYLKSAQETKNKNSEFGDRILQSDETKIN